MSKIKVLIVEDEAISALDLKFRINKLGYEPVKIVDNGEDAIKYTEILKPDVVLMDIIIKGDIDGIKAAEEITSKFSVPIIYTTGCSDSETVERAKKTKYIAYILKPYDINILEKTIESAIKTGN